MYEKKKEARKICLRPGGVLIEELLRASPHSITSQTRGFAPQTMLGIVSAERQAKRLAG